MTQDEKYMKEAIKQAKKAAAIEEVPIGENSKKLEKSRQTSP